MERQTQARVYSCKHLSSTGTGKSKPTHYNISRDILLQPGYAGLSSFLSFCCAHLSIRTVFLKPLAAFLSLTFYPHNQACPCPKSLYLIIICPVQIYLQFILLFNFFAVCVPLPAYLGRQKSVQSVQNYKLYKFIDSCCMLNMCHTCILQFEKSLEGQ